MYDRRVGDHTLSFGVSGRLYNSNLLLYDRQTGSLWSQLTAEAVAGRLTGARLDTVPFSIATWQEWEEQHPHTLVLADQRIPALLSTVGKVVGTLFFPLRLFALPEHVQTHAALSALVLGVTIGGESKAYPLDTLARTAVPVLTDTIGGQALRIFFSPRSRFAYAEDTKGQRLPAIVTYRVTWLAFYPHSQIYAVPR